MEYPLPFDTYGSDLKRENLLGLKCRECGTITCPPKMTCQHCHGRDVEVAEL